MPQPNSISWVILAGGQASRMNGEDKGLIQLNGKPLIKHVYDQLTAQTSNIVINANRNQAIYATIAPVVSDLITDFPGPLGGIHAGLQQIESEWVGFVPCDTPMLNHDLVNRFTNAITPKSDILVAHDGDFVQPVFTLYHKRVFPKLDAFLQRGERKIILFYQECQVVNVDFSDSPNCFINLNTPQELEQFGNLL